MKTDVKTSQCNCGFILHIHSLHTQQAEQIINKLAEGEIQFLHEAKDLNLSHKMV
jgi:hypothetical protein